ncbi:MAG: DUF1549 domain-containing protein, partial [Verrucomicrobiota bacterium]
MRALVLIPFLSLLAIPIQARQPEVSPIVSIDQAAGAIDSFIESGYERFEVEPERPLTDEEFLRRIYLSAIGRIPSIPEAEAFLRDERPAKREKLIASLLRSEGHVSHLYNFWADVLRINEGLGNGARAAEAAYRLWVKDAIRSNKPYDEFVREMVSSRGYIWETGAIGYY